MENKFDEFHNISNSQGKEFCNLPFKLRVKMHMAMDKDSLKQFQLGRADADLITKAQAIFDDYFREMNPTDEDFRKSRIESQAYSKQWNLNRSLKNAKEKLAQLDNIVKNDGKIGYGQREQLRMDIAGFEKELQISQSMTEDKGTTTDDWMTEFLK